MGGRAGGGAGFGSRAGGAYDRALEEYVSGEGMWINQYLRGNGDFGELSPQEKQYLADLEKATSKPLGKDYDLYRAADAKSVFGHLTDQEYGALQATLVYGSKEKYYQKYVASAMAKAGGVKTEKGFMSTTTSKSVAEGWGDFTGAEHPIVMKFKAPKTTKGKNLAKFDKSYDAQHEVLLGKGQKYKVGKVYGKNGNIYVDVSLL